MTLPTGAGDAGQGGAIVIAPDGHLQARTYTTGGEDAQKWVECLRCGLKSYNPTDVRELYCGHCHAYHRRHRAAGATESPERSRHAEGML